MPVLRLLLPSVPIKVRQNLREDVRAVGGPVDEWRRDQGVGEASPPPVAKERRGRTEQLSLGQARLNLESQSVHLLDDVRTEEVSRCGLEWHCSWAGCSRSM
jgi:hypothetical protein